MNDLPNLKRKAVNSHLHPLQKGTDLRTIIIRKEPHGVAVIRIPVHPHTTGDVVEILQGRETAGAGLIVGTIIGGVVGVEGMGNGGAGAAVMIATISSILQTAEPDEEGKDEIYLETP